jgi:hypothetical protein
MKLLLVNDLHLASAGPATRLDDWHATVERKLDFVTATAESRDVDAICIAGDIARLLLGGLRPDDRGAGALPDVGATHAASGARHRRQP